MSKLPSFLVSLMVAAGVGIMPTPAAAAPSARQIATDVRAVFAAKCALCHGPDVAHPKCRFGYVTDLARVAANPEMIIPNSHEESELWTLVSRGEMPPSDSPHGPLAAEQRDLIRTWIKSGAPDASAADKTPATAEKAEDRTKPAVVEPAEATLVHRLLTWLGKFHLLFIHFPIALVLAAAAGELLSLWLRIPTLTSAARYCLSLAAIAAVPTAALGWLFAATSFSESASPLLTAHRWLGTTAAVLLVITAVSANRSVRRGAEPWRLRLLLLLAALITALTAHLGGLMAHGPDFFAF
ncbi:MAG TPA: DUF2231 domain-containing protein [Pirellulales bacterium]